MLKRQSFLTRQRRDKVTLKHGLEKIVYMCMLIETHAAEKVFNILSLFGGRPAIENLHALVFLVMELVAIGSFN